MVTQIWKFDSLFVARCGCRREPHLDMRRWPGDGGGGAAAAVVLLSSLEMPAFMPAPKIALYVFAADLPHQCNCGRLSRKSLPPARVATFLFLATQRYWLAQCL